MTALTSQFEREMGQSLSRIQDAIAPYTRFVRAERDRLGSVRDELAWLRKSLDGLKAKVSSI